MPKSTKFMADSALRGTASLASNATHILAVATQRLECEKVCRDGRQIRVSEWRVDASVAA